MTASSADDPADCKGLWRLDRVVRRILCCEKVFGEKEVVECLKNSRQAGDLEAAL